jgi:general stress protein 26
VAEMLEKMKELVREKDFCVLATVSGNEPHCSLMAYTAGDQGEELYLSTNRDTAKYRNIKENQHISLLIDTRADNLEYPLTQGKALTVKGVCAEIEDQDKRERVRALFLKAHPAMKDFLANPEVVFLQVTVVSYQLLEGLTESSYELV